MLYGTTNNGMYWPKTFARCYIEPPVPWINSEACLFISLQPAVRSNESVLCCLWNLAQSVPTMNEMLMTGKCTPLSTEMMKNSLLLLCVLTSAARWCHLVKVDGALLICFHGPTAESTLSEMGNFAIKRHYHLAHMSYLSSHQVQQFLKPDGFVKRFHRENTNHSPIYLGGRLLRNMRAAYESRSKLPTTLPTYIKAVCVGDC